MLRTILFVCELTISINHTSILIHLHSYLIMSRLYKNKDNRLDIHTFRYFRLMVDIDIIMNFNVLGTDRQNKMF